MVTFLPLIERELRVRARSRSVYWTRFAVALAGTMLCLRMLNLSVGPSGASLAMLGHGAFRGIATAAFVLCCCAGFLTLDGISRERREGTLGLLCLTRVKELDVLVGSFGSAGITCACALLAFVPVLMLPVLAGGVTGGESFRTMLVLFDTMFLSLAVGLWASAGARGWFQSARSAVVRLLLIIVVPTLALMLPAPVAYVFGVSPLAAFSWADDAVYRFSVVPFWWSLAAVHIISWRFLIGAGFRLRRAMREEDGTAQNIGAAEGKAAVARAPLADGGDPVGWLVRRQRGIKAVVWAGVLISLIPFAARFFISPFGISAIVVSIYLNAAVSLAFAAVQLSLFGWAASRFLVEARRAGELELLLTTPVGATTLVSSLWKELTQVFFLPVIVITAPGLLLSLYYRFVFHNPPVYVGPLGYGIYSALVPFVNSVTTILGVGALIWAGLWFGLRARSQAGAIVHILLFAGGVPLVVEFASSWLIHLVVFLVGGFVVSWGLWLNMLIPAATCFYDVWLIRWARRRLAMELNNPSPEGFDLSDLFAEARSGLASLIRKARQWPPAPER
jgi:hypothetical protein